MAVSQGSTFSGWGTYIGSSDTQAPTAPANLAVTGVTSNSISLNWTASTDNVGVTGYRIYRNGGRSGHFHLHQLHRQRFGGKRHQQLLCEGLRCGGQSLGRQRLSESGRRPPVRGATGRVRFQHFTIRDPLPGTSWGTAGTLLADFDGDGDLDCALSRRDAHGFWWYERRTDSTWVQHLICDSAGLQDTTAAGDCGAVSLDIDNDGWTDVAFSQVWCKNPGTLRQQPDSAWTVNSFAGSGHDMLAADINRDGRKDIVVFDGNNLRWFNPALSMASNTVAQNMGQHGGVSSAGGGGH